MQVVGGLIKGTGPGGVGHGPGRFWPKLPKMRPLRPFLASKIGFFPYESLGEIDEASRLNFDPPPKTQKWAFFSENRGRVDRGAQLGLGKD